MTEIVMSALIRRSSRKGGMGMIIATTMPRTARGMLNSARFPNRDGGPDHAAPSPEMRVLTGASFGLGRPPVPATTGAEMGAICGEAAMSAGTAAFA